MDFLTVNLLVFEKRNFIRFSFEKLWQCRKTILHEMSALCLQTIQASSNSLIIKQNTFYESQLNDVQALLSRLFDVAKSLHNFNSVAKCFISFRDIDIRYSVHNLGRVDSDKSGFQNRFSSSLFTFNVFGHSQCFDYRLRLIVDILQSQQMVDP